MGLSGAGVEGAFDQDVRRWEIACFFSLMRRFAEAPTTFSSIGRELRGMRLEGHRPQTAIVVTVFDLRQQTGHEMHFRLWQEMVGMPGYPADPDELTWLMAINAGEP